MGVDWVQPAQNREKCRAICEHGSELLGSIKNDDNADSETLSFNEFARISFFLRCFL
jgi:hypothetical protein